MKKPRRSTPAPQKVSRIPAPLRRFAGDPLNVISTFVFLVWAVVGIWFRPIGDFGVETDFYGDFVPFAREWMSGHPTVMLGYRGPFYYLLIGILSTVGDAFLLAKIVSAACAGIGVRIIGGLLRRLWNPAVAVTGSLFLAANLTLIQYSYRACTDLVYWVLFATTLTLFWTENKRHHRTWAVAGLCAGIAYLTRYNGVALVPAGLVAAFILVRPWKRTATTALAFLGAWFVIAAPWLIFLWQQTGDPFWNRNFALIAEEVYSPDATLANVGQMVNAVGFYSLDEVFRLDPGRFLGSMAGNLFRHLWLDGKLLVGPVWAVLGLAGFAVSLRTRGSRPRLAFILVGGIAYLSLLPVFYNQRFMLTLLIWWSAGIGNAAHFLMGRFRQPVIKWGLVGVLVIAALQATTLGIRRSQGIAGGESMPLAVLKLAKSVRESGHKFGPETPIVARKPQIGYYLEAPVAAIPRRMDIMAASGMHYLMVSDIESRMYPHLAPMLTVRRPVRNFPGFRFVAGASHREKSGRNQTATLYAVENPAAWSPPDFAATPAPPPSVAGLERMDHLRTNLVRWYLNWTLDEPLFPLLSRLSPASRSHPLVRMTEGDAHLASRDYEQAAGIYKDLLAGPGDPADILLRLALVSHLAGDFANFERYMNEFVTRAHPDGEMTMDDWKNETALRLNDNKFFPTAALLIQIRRLDPDSKVVEDYRILGYCYLNMRHPDLARTAFDTYLRYMPNDPEIKGIMSDSRLTGNGP